MTETTAGMETEARRKRRGVAWHARRHPTVTLGAALLGVIVIATLFAPWLSSHDPLAIDPLARLQMASPEHILGTDAIGRDLWSRTIHGGRVSLVVGFTVALFNLLQQWNGLNVDEHGVSHLSLAEFSL